MYGLSSKEDLSFLVGRGLDQLCLSEHQVQLNFDQGVSIRLSTDLVLQRAGNLPVRYEDLLTAAPALLPLIHASVSRAWAKPPGTLCLEFSTGDLLEIEEDDQHHECYEIRNGDRLIVV